jgi:ABC-type polysaccharide/polyol phosphate transport system ATPase subunit
MNSSSPSNILLEAKNLHLEYRVRLYAHMGLRDSFIAAVKNPWDFVMKSPDMLPVLRGLNLTLHKGDRLGILGVNGAGKTSLCRILCGMIKPQIGTLETYGSVEAIFDVATGVMPELTGRENAYLLARLFYDTREVPKEQVEEALSFSELGPFLDMPYKTYSRGMQARLVLSLISAKTSQILILDEVFDGADIFFREKIAARMMKKIENSDAVVFVSHGPEQMLQLCNRVVVLSQGEIVFDGPPQEAIDYYLKNSSSMFGKH